MMYDTMWATEASQLAIVARELEEVGRRVAEAAVHARSLAAAVDWQAAAAEVFHTRAEEWAREISSLGCLAETARLAAARARDTAWLRAEAGA